MTAYDERAGDVAGRDVGDDSFAMCTTCNFTIEMCACVCPFCGERDKCECALFDAATGGG